MFNTKLLALVVLLSAGGWTSHPQQISSPGAVPFILASDLITVHALVAKAPVLLRVDTGLSSMMLDSALVRRTALVSDSKEVKLYGATGVAREMGSVVKDAPLSVGTNNFIVPLALTRDLSELRRDTELEVDGILGSALFRYRRVTIDYNAGLLIIDGPEPVGARVFLSNIDVKLLPIIHTRLLAGREQWVDADFLIDTGSQFGVMISSHFAHKHRDSFLEGSMTAPGAPSAGLTGRANGHSGVIRELQMGPLTSANIEAVVSDAESGVLAGKHLAGTLGNEFLRHYRVTLDYPAGRVLFEPNPN